MLDVRKEVFPAPVCYSATGFVLFATATLATLVASHPPASTPGFSKNVLLLLYRNLKFLFHSTNPFKYLMTHKATIHSCYFVMYSTGSWNEHHQGRGDEDGVTAPFGR